MGGDRGTGRESRSRGREGSRFRGLLATRRRLASHGASTLSDSELMRLVTDGESDAPIERLASLPLEALTTAFHGHRPCAERFAASLELGRRALTRFPMRRRVQTPQAAYVLLGPRLRGHAREYFCALYLNQRQQLLELRTIATGTTHGCLVDPRDLFAPALELGATVIVLAHNHPSGETSPSAEDIALSQRLCAAARLLGLRIVDHLIVGDGYTSLASKGLLDVGPDASHLLVSTS